MSKRTAKYKKHPLKGCYKMRSKTDKFRAEMLLGYEGTWLRDRMHITNAMIIDETTRISGIDWLQDKDKHYSKSKYQDATLQAAHNLIVRSKKYAR